ncbi:MAG: phosphotransferase [Candidatus Wildermuthbacteria bacterium]|nr:phosphotransferase [Candidatus Wildermuthbacteria bacterium]
MQKIGKEDLELICRLDRRWKPEVIQVKQLGGQTNRNFVVAYRKEKYFVRLPWEHEDIVDRVSEGKNILVMARNKKLRRILPEYRLYILKRKNILAPASKKRFAVPDGTMVSEFLEGSMLTMRHFRQRRYQRALAKTLAAFHGSGVRFVNPYNVFQDEIRKYRLKAMRHSLSKFFSKGVLVELLAIEKEAEQRLQEIPKGVSSHNDIIFQNILVPKNGTLRLLDFEYAGLNKKGGIYYDLGYVFRDSFFNPPRMSQEIFEHFLAEADTAYKKKLDRTQIYWAVIAALLVGIWWGVLRYSSVPRKERAYFQIYIKRGVEGALYLRSLMSK